MAELQQVVNAVDNKMAMILRRIIFELEGRRRVSETKDGLLLAALHLMTARYPHKEDTGPTSWNETFVRWKETYEKYKPKGRVGHSIPTDRNDYMMPPKDELADFMEEHGLGPEDMERDV